VPAARSDTLPSAVPLNDMRASTSTPEFSVWAKFCRFWKMNQRAVAASKRVKPLLDGALDGGRRDVVLLLDAPDVDGHRQRAGVGDQAQVEGLADFGAEVGVGAGQAEGRLTRAAGREAQRHALRLGQVDGTLPPRWQTTA
jgi:hypothetical protein